MKRTLSLTRAEENAAIDLVFLLADEARSQYRRSGRGNSLKARTASLCLQAELLKAKQSPSERRRTLALIVCRALEALLFMGNPGSAITQALKSKDLERM